ncbi:MAG: hypothetical protein IKO06_02455 [Alphaproteobacteria bacterium]|nr:hypothetical protein [Alphaproteobacteria bacterium]
MINLKIKNQNGRSMIEMLGVLAIIGVLSVGGIAGYSKAMMKYRINKTIEQITLIAGNVRTFFAPQKNYKGLSSGTDEGKAIIQKAKLVPDEMWNEDKTAMENAFGAKVGLSNTTKAKSGDAQAFIISYRIPIEMQEVCIELLSYDWTIAGVKGIVVFEADATSNSMSGNPVGKTPINIDDAIKLCNPVRSDSIYKVLSMLFDVDDECVTARNGYFAGVCK